MQTRSALARIERAERAAKAQSKFAADCICFPHDEQPQWMYEIQLAIAHAVKCRLHGDRFWRRVFIEVAEWRREKQELALNKYYSAQYRKAWYASFPKDLWPPDEVMVDGKRMLRLKNGTLLPEEPTYPVDLSVISSALSLSATG